MCVDDTLNVLFQHQKPPVYAPQLTHKKQRSFIFLPLDLFPPPSSTRAIQPPLSPLCLHLCITTTVQYLARATESLDNEMASGHLKLPSAIRHLICV